jgi:hypothetical protein
MIFQRLLKLLDFTEMSHNTIASTYCVLQCFFIKQQGMQTYSIMERNYDLGMLRFVGMNA